VLRRGDPEHHHITAANYYIFTLTTPRGHGVRGRNEGGADEGTLTAADKSMSNGCFSWANGDGRWD